MHGILQYSKSYLNEYIQEILQTLDVVETSICSSLALVISGTLQIGSISSLLLNSAAIVSTTS